VPDIDTLETVEKSQKTYAIGVDTSDWASTMPLHSALLTDRGG